MNACCILQAILDMMIEVEHFRERKRPYARVQVASASGGGLSKSTIAGLIDRKLKKK